MIKRSLYFLVCALEGIWPLAALLSLPRSASAEGVLGFSPLRLGLILAVLFFIALFAYLAWREGRAKSANDSLIERLLAHRYAVLLAAPVFILFLAAGYILVLSPLGSGRLYSYFLRFQPLFIWGALIVAQFFLLALLLRGSAYWIAAGRDLGRDRYVRRLRRALSSPATGYLLLAAAFLIGLSKVYYGRFVDEADNLTTGWLVSQGVTLYRDVFSHHFPFPYYWVALVVKLFGSSFVVVRISLLVLQAALFALSMRLSRFYLPLGLAALAWSLTNQFHRGQEAIYASFEAILLVAAFAVILALLVRRRPAGKSALATCGILLGLAVLTDPLMIYPALIGLAAIFASGMRCRSGRLREGLRRALWAGGAALAVAGIFTLSLLASGTAGDFYREAIWFNAEIYAKYEDADPNRTGSILQNSVSGLNIFAERWHRYTSPFVPLNTYRSVRLEDENLFAAWIFAGFLSRLSILACGLGLVLNRKYLAALFLYLFAAALLVRADAGLYAMGFALLSLFAAFYLLAVMRRPVWIRALRSRGRSTAQLSWLVAQTGWLVLVAIIGLMQLWSAFRGGYYLADHWDAIRNKRHITMFNQFGDEIRELTCNQPGVEISVFPINPIVHFVTGIPPASRYTFMYPWVAEIGQRELIAELRQHPSAVVWIKTSRKSGSPEGVAAYMADTIDFLNKEYIVMGEDFWMSPELAERCSVTPGKIPFTQDMEQ